SGIALGNAGDVNGDGISDILLSNHDYNNTMGQSYVIFGCCPDIPGDNSKILGIVIGVTGGVILAVVTSVVAYCWYQNHNSYTKEETIPLDQATIPIRDAEAKLRFLNHQLETSLSTPR
ncbi:MAG: hypothetical protein C5B43_03140, partial [Verrucomicrobia bacterium]